MRGGQPFRPVRGSAVGSPAERRHRHPAAGAGRPSVARRLGGESRGRRRRREQRGRAPITGWRHMGCRQGSGVDPRSTPDCKGRGRRRPELPPLRAGVGMLMPSPACGSSGRRVSVASSGPSARCGVRREVGGRRWRRPGWSRRWQRASRSRATGWGAALLRRRPKGLLPAARQELLDPSKAWWGGRRGRLADWPPYSISVSLGVVPRWYSRVVEVPVRIEVAAGFVAPGASEPPRLQPSWPPGGSRPAHG